MKLRSIKNSIFSIILFACVAFLPSYAQADSDDNLTYDLTVNNDMTANSDNKTPEIVVSNLKLSGKVWPNIHVAPKKDWSNKLTTDNADNKVTYSVFIITGKNAPPALLCNVEVAYDPNAYKYGLENAKVTISLPKYPSEYYICQNISGQEHKTLKRETKSTTDNVDTTQKAIVQVNRK